MPFPSKTSPEAILQAALAHLEEDGLEAFSVRAVAARLELAPNALYRYFPDRSALLAGLSELGERDLLERLRAAVGRRSGTSAVRAMSRAYVQYAAERPALYQVGIAHHGSEAQAEVWQFVAERVGAVTGPRTAERAGKALWAYVHGVAALHAAGLLEGGAEQVADYGVRALLAGLESGSAKR